MKHTTQNSPLSRSFETAQPRQAQHSVAEALRQGSRPIRFARLRSTKYDPIADKQINYEIEAAPKTGDITKVMFEKVAGLQGCKTACALSESSTRRIRYEAVNQETGETEQRIARLVTTKIAVLSYGKVFHFTKTNRGTTILDSRDGSRRSQSFVRSELRRMLGATEGDNKFAELVG